MIRDRALLVGLFGGAAVVGVAVSAAGRAAGTWALLVCAAAAGAALVHLGARVQVPRRVGRLLCYGVIIASAAAIFGPPLAHHEGVGLEDWGAHRLVVGTMVDAMRQGRFVYWTNAANAGEPFADLYPSPSYVLAAVATLVFHARGAVPQVLAWIAVLAHLGVALGTARVALRVAPWPAALFCGMAMLLELGDDSSLGGTAVLKWALFHEAFGVALFLVASASVLDFLERPRTATAIAIWIFGALSVATYLTCVVTMLAAIGALVGAALLGTRTTRPRCALAAVHLGVALLLGAIVWQPLAARIGVYSLHFGNPPHPIGELFRSIVMGALPVNGVQLFNLLGYAGLLAAVASRRAAPVFVGLVGLLLLAGLLDLTYLSIGVDAASHAVARFSALRLAGLAKPFLFVAGAYGVAAMVRSSAAPAARRPRVWVGALTAVALAVGVATSWSWIGDRGVALREQLFEPLPNPDGWAGLTAWARERTAQQRPDHYGRLLFEGWAFYPFNLTAETGLPLTYRWSAPAFHNRERIESTDPATLEKYAIRWVANRGDHPMLGNAATEHCFGEYCVREVPGWTGDLAHVRRGAGDAHVVALDTDSLTVDLRHTTRPALVELSFSYYPRWRATHGDRELPVYGVPARAMDPEHGRLLALWLPPGLTRLHCDGALPSDHAGEPAFLLGFLLVSLTLVLDRKRRVRRRLLRRVALGRRWLAARRNRAWATATVVVAAGLVGAVVVGTVRDDVGLVLARRLAPDAAVLSRVTRGPWHRCTYERIPGQFVCPDGPTLYGVQAYTLHESEAGWNFVTPGIRITTTSAADLVITMRRRIGSPLVTSVLGARAISLGIDGAPPVGLTSVHATVPLDRPGMHTFTWRAHVDAGATATLVAMRADAIDVDRTTDVPTPPETSPF